MDPGYVTAGPQPSQVVPSYAPLAQPPQGRPTENWNQSHYSDNGRRQQRAAVTYNDPQASGNTRQQQGYQQDEEHGHYGVYSRREQSGFQSHQYGAHRQGGTSRQGGAGQSMALAPYQRPPPPPSVPYMEYAVIPLSCLFISCTIFTREFDRLLTLRNIAGDTAGLGGRVECSLFRVCSHNTTMIQFQLHTYLLERL